MSKNHKDHNKAKHLDAKQPRASATPKGDKTPRAAVVPDQNCYPDFRTERMDLDGPWRWDNLKSLHLQDLLQKIFHSQKLTW